MKLDSQRILDLFSAFAGLPDEELEKHSAFCRAAERRIMGMLRENVNIKCEMERLCMAAAALACCDYKMMTAGKSGGGEIKIGDIALKGDALAGSGELGAIRGHFLESIADLVRLPTGFAFVSAGEA